MRLFGGEEMMEQKLKDAGIIAADSIVQAICPKDAQFFELPHIAFSGRIYLKKIKQMPGFADPYLNLRRTRDGIE